MYDPFDDIDAATAVTPARDRQTTDVTLSADQLRDLSFADVHRALGVAPPPGTAEKPTAFDLAMCRARRHLEASRRLSSAAAVVARAA
jgi:hypothetical protein